MDSDPGSAEAKNRIRAFLLESQPVSSYDINSSHQSKADVKPRSPGRTAVNALPGPDWPHPRISHSFDSNLSKIRSRRVFQGHLTCDEDCFRMPLLSNLLDLFRVLHNNRIQILSTLSAISLRLWITPVSLLERRVAKPTSLASGHPGPYSRVRVL